MGPQTMIRKVSEIIGTRLGTNSSPTMHSVHDSSYNTQRGLEFVLQYTASMINKHLERLR